MEKKLIALYLGIGFLSVKSADAQYSQMDMMRYQHKTHEKYINKKANGESV